MSVSRPSSLKIDQGHSVQNARPSPQEIMSAVEAFKSAVIRIRDILRSCAITGMDSMRHICLYLMSRYITRERAVTLGVPDQLCWETFMELVRRVEGGKEFALDRFHHAATEETLVREFDRLFGTEDFPFNMKNVTKHTEILEILDKVEMDKVDCEMDILGWVYEQHLKTGSSAARDLGQFFTDRFICKYIVGLCAPRLMLDGVPESVCDPSMGTGGFLTEYVKYINQAYPGLVNWSVQRDKIHGCDTDTKVAGVARLNLFMELGGHRAENLLTKDSLQGDLPLTGYDLILANMPFGLKGLKHADCCERVRDLKIRGTKSEPLFLQLMMVSLNRGGRCAVVVPDGMLVNQSGCHDGTRKYLLENFELRKVIKMTGKFFMNTSIQPSILFFENTGKATEAVEFWNVVRGERDAVEETLVATVTREQIMADASCSLDVRRYLEAEKPKANGVGWPMVKLGELFHVKGGKAISKKDLIGTKYPYYGCNGINGYVDEYLYDGEFIVCAQDGSIGSVYLVHDKFYPSNHTHILYTKDATRITNAYGTYFLKMMVDWKKITTSIIPKVTQAKLLDIDIPLPPLPIQHEIVATLDRIYSPGTTDLADTLRLTTQAMDLVLADPTGATLEPVVEAQRLMRKSAQMVADVKTQMVAVVKSVERRGFPVVKLSSVLNLVSGKANKERENGLPVPYYDSNGIIGYVKEPLYTGEYIITARNLSIGAVHYVNGSFYPSDHTINFTTLDSSILNNRFFYYWLHLNNKVLKELSSGIKPGIRKSDVAEIQMPLPPIPFQKALVARLDALQAQLDALLSLQRQSEDNARFILESYLGGSSTSPTEPEVRIVRDDAKEEQEAGVIYVDPEAVESVEETEITEAAEAATRTTVEPVKKTRRPKMSKKE